MQSLILYKLDSTSVQYTICTIRTNDPISSTVIELYFKCSAYLLLYEELIRA
jgi:hypothetical protein